MTVKIATNKKTVVESNDKLPNMYMKTDKALKIKWKMQMTGFDELAIPSFVKIKLRMDWLWLSTDSIIDLVSTFGCSAMLVDLGSLLCSMFITMSLKSYLINCHYLLNVILIDLTKVRQSVNWALEHFNHNYDISSLINESEKTIFWNNQGYFR